MLACLSSGSSTLQSLIKPYNVAAVVLAISPERALCLRPHKTGHEPSSFDSCMYC